MTETRRRSVTLSAGIVAALAVGSAAAADLAPYGRDLPPPPAGGPYTLFHEPPRPRPPTGSPARVVTGDPGYVGSDYGLGKPSFWGIGTRPDWGRSNPD